MPTNGHPADRFARAYYGVSRKPDLLETMSRRQLDHWISTGRVERRHRGVLVAAAAPPSAEQSLLAAVWAGGEAAASHRSAAALWGLISQWPECPEIVIADPRRRRIRGVVVHRMTDLGDHCVTTCRQVPVTTPPLTLVQLGAVVGPTVVGEAVERGLLQRLVTVDDLRAALKTFGRSGRNGAGVLRSVLEDRALGDEPTDSLLESAMARLLRRHGLPAAVYQYVIRWRGSFVARVDFAYPVELVAIEVDGFSAHGSPRAMARDFDRQNALQALGWTVLRFTWHQVIKEPLLVAERIANVLLSRTHLTRA
jgi:very-short-patch-repair endonuclease